MSRIVVGMSGGVDSSTVAAILKSQGHDVIGITLRLYDHGMVIGKKGACCAGQDIYDAQVVAQKIGIPHYVLDYESNFKKDVIDAFAESYMKGDTPIPCINCNQKVKFKDMLKTAKDLNADYMATGHYVKKVINQGKSELHKGVDLNKDQSYFIFTVTQEQLDYLLFPLGELSKPETREIAAKFDLNTANKPDSQDICFVPNGDYSSIIRKLRPEAYQIGEIMHVNGTVVGSHEGIVNYTIGQRKGLGIAYKEPLYVIELDAKNNKVIVGEKRYLKQSFVKIRLINWLADISADKYHSSFTVKLRSMHSGSVARFHSFEQDNIVQIALDEFYNAITPGQACVIYDGSRLLGGGWILRS